MKGDAVQSREVRRSEAWRLIVWKLVAIAVLLVAYAIVERGTAAMDATTLSSALSTLAQCATALAALIGFLGLWQLDRLRGEDDQLEQRIQTLVININGFRHDAIARLGRAYFIQEAWKIVKALRDSGDKQTEPPALKRWVIRWEDLPSKQRRLLYVLIGFLVVTLVIILIPAIVGLTYVKQVENLAWPPWLLYLASAWLAVAPAYVVWQAARSVYPTR